MINRICISINNCCNLSCKYCHFHEKGVQQASDMDVYKILDNVIQYTNQDFKIGFVGNGEPFLDLLSLKSYIEYVEQNSNISIYTITNGTINLKDEDWAFFEKHNVNVGFSIDGYKELHDYYRCNSFDKAMANVEHYRSVTGHYPTFNPTVGKESLENVEKVVDFFTQFGTKITFSRMIGKYGISLDEYREFLLQAEKKLNIRRGDKDCTMYGGQCAAGVNNLFFANNKIYICGNCIDMRSLPASTPFGEINFNIKPFNRNYCYKEIND